MLYCLPKFMFKSRIVECVRLAASKLQQCTIPPSPCSWQSLVELEVKWLLHNTHKAIIRNFQTGVWVEKVPRRERDFHIIIWYFSIIMRPLFTLHAVRWYWSMREACLPSYWPKICRARVTHNKPGSTHFECWSTFCSDLHYNRLKQWQYQVCKIPLLYTTWLKWRWWCLIFSIKITKKKACIPGHKWRGRHTTSENPPLKIL